MRAPLFLAMLAFGQPVLAQKAVSALPPTYTTWNNVTSSFQTGPAISYFGDANRYVEAATVNGVPNNLMSYFVTQGNPFGLGVMRSVVFLPATPLEPAKFLFPTTPAGIGNTSLGGRIDAFGWGSADVVMNICFGGGFAFNVAGSLQGATPRLPPGAPRLPADNVIPFSFASAANYNEYAFGHVLPDGIAAPSTITSVTDFSQGHAVSQTPPIATGNYLAYLNGRARDPFTVGGTPYGGGGNQVPGTLQAGGFESPVYASSDPLVTVPGFGQFINPLGPSNGRSYTTDAAKRWALLIGATPDRPEFSLDIQRQYAAMIRAGIPREHIIVLYGDGTASSLARFTALAAANNVPDVNAILDTVRPGFEVPVHGAASEANVVGLLNAASFQNPAAPAAARVTFWQALRRAGPGTPTPAAGDGLILYVTGHGSAVNILGGGLAVANRLVGPRFQTDFIIEGPGNLKIIPGTNLEAQITVRGFHGGIGTGLFLLNGSPLDPASLLPAPSGPLLDMHPFIGPGLSYYRLLVPADLLLPEGSAKFTLAFASADVSTTQYFEESFATFSWLNASREACEEGRCDLYTSLIRAKNPFAIPEPSSWVMLVAGFGLIGGMARRGRFQTSAAGAGGGHLWL